MSDESYHTKITIEVTTFKDTFMVHMSDEHDPASTGFDLTQSRSPREAIDDALGAMAKVLVLHVRKFIASAKEMGYERSPTPAQRFMEAGILRGPPRPPKKNVTP